VLPEIAGRGIKRRAVCEVPRVGPVQRNLVLRTEGQDVAIQTLTLLAVGKRCSQGLRAQVARPWIESMDERRRLPDLRIGPAVVKEEPQIVSRVPDRLKLEAGGLGFGQIEIRHVG